MTKIEYKYAHPDAKQYIELFDSTGWNAIYKANLSELSKALENSWLVVTAYDAGELVGIGRIVSDGVLYAMIYDLIVMPSHQGRGIGTTILGKLIDRCKDAEIRDVQLFSSKGKVRFYSKRGFVERPKDAPGMRFSKG
ncbi:MAG: GNAT family N-acetyltransferase [Deltaproteobacteria bacterium]|nr:GNAT family N-acetyltransferase [Deltaproteobacteria bacterium]